MFGLRSKEHRNLQYYNFRIEFNCIIYDETVSKTYHGGLKDLKYKPRVVKHVCCVDKNDKHFPCLVNCYTKYIDNIRSLDKNKDAFYFKPNPDSAVFSYQNSPLGINTLNKILPELCGAAGLPRKTSHNLRVTCATRLFQNSVDEKLIRDRTGHRSNALFTYEKPSIQQEVHVSKILGPPKDITDMKNKNLNLIPDIEIPDEILSNMTLPIETVTSNNKEKDDNLCLLPDFEILDEFLSNINLPSENITSNNKEKDGNFCLLPDFEISDEFLSNMSLPNETVTSNVSSKIANSVFNNCTFNFK